MRHGNAYFCRCGKVFQEGFGHTNCPAVIADFIVEFMEILYDENLLSSAGKNRVEDLLEKVRAMYPSAEVARLEGK